jgi:hypothetical protein
MRHHFVIWRMMQLPFPTLSPVVQFDGLERRNLWILQLACKVGFVNSPVASSPNNRFRSASQLAGRILRIIVNSCHEEMDSPMRES